VDRLMATGLLLVLAGLVALTWVTLKGRGTERRAWLIVGLLGAVLGLSLNAAIGRFNNDPGLYSDPLVVASALTAGLVLSRRSLGFVAVALTLFLALSRVGGTAHYPSAGLGALAGLVCVAFLFPLHRPVARTIAFATSGRGNSPAEVVTPHEVPQPVIGPRSGPLQTAPPNEVPQRNFRVRSGLLVSALLVMAAVLGFALRGAMDRSAIHAGQRADAMLQPDLLSRPPAEYPGIQISEIAGGHYQSAHASVLGDVTQVTHEVDGDIHVLIQAGRAFLVAEIIPEFPLPLPRTGEEITAWGIVRHDGIHSWWELHPLIGWVRGDVFVPGKPGSGSGE
jgi:hypothetical protein